MSKRLLPGQDLYASPTMSSLRTGDLEMKKQQVDSKKAAANDKENGNGRTTKAAKPIKPALDEKYSIASHPKPVHLGRFQGFRIELKLSRQTVFR
jgi:hypothetical protein